MPSILSYQRLLNGFIKNTICLALVTHQIKLNSRAPEQMNPFHLLWHKAKCAKLEDDTVSSLWKCHLTFFTSLQVAKGQNNQYLQAKGITNCLRNMEYKVQFISPWFISAISINADNC